ncbi:MAG: hypothetical protein HUU54_00890 [Ignavibacteriaceae bacterium]|nr:hypothetical protein [Ignavibacteriaceae bacterium]
MKAQILIIDDNTGELKKLREILASYGYGILTATDPVIAEQISKKLPVKYVLSKKEYVNFSEKEPTKS